jgi:mannose-6-phosphate isomerase-like protein (cupin superfamily)
MKSEISLKPWGSEYLLFQNKDVAVWHLSISPGQSTSLHSHPNKKTGLIVLGGVAKVSFLTADRVVHPSKKIMIRQGVFHKSTNEESDWLTLLEVETPVDKSDLLRLEDNYGREGTEYKHEVGDDIFIPEINKIPFHFGSCDLSKRKPKHLRSIVDDFSYIIITGGCYSKEGLCAAGPGDVLDQNTYPILRDKFSFVKGTTGWLITR